MSESTIPTLSLYPSGATNRPIPLVSGTDYYLVFLGDSFKTDPSHLQASENLSKAFNASSMMHLGTIIL